MFQELVSLSPSSAGIDRHTRMFQELVSLSPSSAGFDRRTRMFQELMSLSPSSAGFDRRTHMFQELVFLSPSSAGFDRHSTRMFQALLYLCVHLLQFLSVPGGGGCGESSNRLGRPSLQ